MSNTAKSPRFYYVKDYFDRKRWSLTRVQNAVGKWITAEEYEEITGLEYPEKFESLNGLM